MKCYHHVSCGIYSFSLYTIHGRALPYYGCNKDQLEVARPSHSLCTSTDMDTRARTKWHWSQAPVYNVWVCGSKLIHLYAMFTLVFVAAIFWNELLLEITTQHSCNPSEVDCFFIDNLGIISNLSNHLTATMWCVHLLLPTWLQPCGVSTYLTATMWCVHLLDCNHVVCPPTSASSTSLTSMVQLGLLDVCLEFVHSLLKHYQLAFFSWSDVMHRGIGHCGILSRCYV